MAVYSTLLQVVLIWSIAVLSPGPNFFISTQTAVTRNRKTALQVVLGIGTGTAFWGVAGFFGMSFLFQAAPLWYMGFKILGGGYLVYLGSMLLLKSFRKAQPDHLAPAPTIVSFIQAYRLGFLTNLANPKAAAFSASLFAATLPASPSLGLGAIIIFIMAFLSTSWYALVAVFFSSAHVTRLYQRFSTRLDRVSGIIFIGFGIKFACYA